MTQTKLEKTVNEIAMNIALIMQQQKGISDTHDRMKVDVRALQKTVYEDGLNSRVAELHADMLERKEREEKEREQTKISNHEKLKSNLALRNLLLVAIVTTVLNIVLELLQH